MGRGLVMRVLKLMRYGYRRRQHGHQQKAHRQGYHDQSLRNVNRHAVIVTGNGWAEAEEGPPAPSAYPSHRLRGSDFIVV